MKKELFIILCVKYLELRTPTADSTLLIRLRLQSWTRCEEWGWQCDRMRYSTQTSVVFHFMCWLWPRFLFPSCLPAHCTVTSAGCHCCQIVSCPNFAVQTSLQFSPQLGQLFPDPCLSLTVLTQSQNNPENPLISQDIDIRWHKQTY